MTRKVKSCSKPKTAASNLTGMTETRRLLAILLVLALGVTVTACGSDDEPESSSTGDTAAQSAEPSPGNDTSPVDGNGAAPEGIEGVEWQLMNIVGDGYATSLPGDVNPPTLTFENGEVEVFAGCNGGTGPAEIGDSSIDFGPIAVTKKACDDTTDQIEILVLNVLGGEVTWELGDDTLTLMRGKEGLVFTQA